MGDYWLEPADWAEKMALPILCPFCREWEYVDDSRIGEPIRLDNTTVIHYYRKGGYEVCVKSDVAKLLRTVARGVK